MTLVDTHCHLDGEAFDADREAVIERARAAGVGSMVAIGSGDGPPDLEAGIRLACAYPFIQATVGVHPHDAAKAVPQTWTELAALCAHPKVVALGETGLDYHYDFSPRAAQREAFVRQLELAREVSLPVVIHTREAWEDTVQLIRDHYAGPGRGGVFHCFSGGPREAATALALGFHLSFSGIVTFPKAEPVREALRLTPLDRLLVETDSPYLAPAPYRGRRNEPAYLVETVKQAAGVKGLPVDELAAAAAENWERLCLRPGAAARYTGRV
jgi:TatD DNase family protein